MIHLNLPYPPSINNYWIASGHRRFISQRGRDFKNDVAAYCKEWRVPNYGDQPVWVDIILRPRSKKLMDIDNCVKPILDSLIGIVYTDDVSVQRITIERGLTIKGGGCTVMVGLMEEDVVPPQA
ncbi:MAG: RusA family crossover junction endodeoxyribonuclease [Alphaproteobacteria bacterium]